MIKKYTLGMITDGLVGKVQRVSLRFTSDKQGETLSIGNDADLQITVDYKIIEQMVEQERAKRRS